MPSKPPDLPEHMRDINSLYKALGAWLETQTEDDDLAVQALVCMAGTLISVNAETLEDLAIGVATAQQAVLRVAVVGFESGYDVTEKGSAPESD